MRFFNWLWSFHLFLHFRLHRGCNLLLDYSCCYRSYIDRRLLNYRLDLYRNWLFFWKLFRLVQLQGRVVLHLFDRLLLNCRDANCRLFFSLRRLFLRDLLRLLGFLLRILNWLVEVLLLFLLPSSLFKSLPFFLIHSRNCMRFFFLDFHHFNLD